MSISLVTVESLARYRSRFNSFGRPGAFRFSSILIRPADDDLALRESNAGFILRFDIFELMQTIPLGVSSLKSSRLAYGCWRLAGSWNPAEVTPASRADGHRAVVAAYEAGFTLFDNADIYCLGEAERILGEAIKEISGMRDRVVIATKGGIRPAGDPQPDSPGRYDFSAEQLTHACEQSLKRLGIETIDVYMLHRPDWLADPEEIAQAFSQLKEAGKVRYFGVSNHSPTQIARLRHYVRQPLVVNQIQLGLSHCHAIVEGMEFLLETTRELPKMLQGVKTAPLANAYAGLAGPGILDYCAMQDIQIQAWSPVRGDLLKPPAEATPQAGKLVRALTDLSRVKGVAISAIALAWLLRHPAGIVPIIGSMNPEHLKENCAADGVELTRDEWYALFDAAADIHAHRRGSD